MLWALDKEWKGLRREVPWVVEKPSRYLRERFRAALQPIDVPPEPDIVTELFTHIGSDSYLPYATDFPHGHTTAPEELLSRLPERLQRAIAVDNPRAVYRLS